MESSGAQPAAAAKKPAVWVQQVSRKLNRPYWFNPATGESVWEEPPEFRKQQSSSNGGAGQSGAAAASAPAPSSAPSSSSSAAASSSAASATNKPSTSASAVDTTTFRSWAGANVRVSAAVTIGIPAFRDAAEDICQTLGKGGDTLQQAPGIHRFPPCDKSFRFILHELAEEFGLGSESSGEGDDRHVVIWREGCTPPEVLAAQQEEAQLEKEAAALRKKEAQMEAAAAAERARAMLLGGGAGGGRGGAGAGAGGSASAAGIDDTEAQEVVPLFAKKDKRSISQINDEIKAKRRRLHEDEGVGGGPV